MKTCSICTSTMPDEAEVCTGCGAKFTLENVSRCPICLNPINEISKEDKLGRKAWYCRACNRKFFGSQANKRCKECNSVLFRLQTYPRRYFCYKCNYYHSA